MARKADESLRKISQTHKILTHDDKFSWLHGKLMKVDRRSTGRAERRTLMEILLAARTEGLPAKWNADGT